MNKIQKVTCSFNVILNLRDELKYNGSSGAKAQGTWGKLGSLKKTFRRLFSENVSNDLSV